MEAILPPAGDTFTLSGTFHGPVVIKSVFQDAAVIAAGLPDARAPQRAALEAALAELQALLEALPEASQPMARKAAESAREVVEAVAAQAEPDFFDGVADGLRTWSTKLHDVAPKILDTAEKIISIAANLRTLGA